MIDPAFIEVLRILTACLDSANVNWALTGSTGMALQGLPVDSTHDIDIQTDEAGAYEIERLLKPYVSEPVRFLSTEKMLSHFGRLSINGVQVEVMGDLQKLGGEDWEDPANLPRYRHWIRVEDFWLPVLSIAYEAAAYAKMGRVEKANLLRAWAEAHPENRVERITNFLEISPLLGTGGQPLPGQIAALAEAGYRAVINLARPDLPISLREEGDLVAAAGMAYTNIPVMFDNPTRADLERFLARMDELQGQRVFVHCVLNMRVSSFVYLYRRLRQGVSAQEASQDLHKIWQPNPTWQQFIEAQL